MRGVGSVRKRISLSKAHDYLRIPDNFFPALIGSNGCLVQIVNDDLWIALTILIYSESREPLFLILLCVRDH